MSVSLNTLKISLDQFNAVSSGKYNIGQMKLSEDGTGVCRVNNRKTFTIFNTTEIGSEESLAIKLAFCNALKKEGLSSEAIKAVKEKLGISGHAVELLKAGTVKPLTAAEVREVIDQYVGQINKNINALPGGN